MKSLILSSGFGTRLYPLTEKKAKGLLEYAGRPLIDHVLDKIPGSVDILVNINRKFEADFRRWQESAPRPVTLCVEDVFTPEESLGAIGSVTHWIRHRSIAEDLMIIASDNYFEFDLMSFISAFNGSNTLIAVHDIGDRSRATQYGVVQLDGHRVAQFQEKPAHPQSSLVATACWILPSRVFPALFEFAEGDRKDNLGSFIAHLITREEVHAFPFSERWVDIGSFEAYQSLQQESAAAEPVAGSGAS